ncbi:hypothetical protein [Limoniibacter endophyticus]|uniref:Uncharacterized protein n=1 Tax=Limoniibacter endophyticus TaxID=1565040 RepID=A0A8J3GID0_9HYPH|nr:hypothetical protein [Limoniibacter endophyticus]GHC77711.1 hypothetical protein GCM10010136_29120 [Limoniibacter endophyticus]
MADRDTAEISTTEARQGRKGIPVLRVLLVALVLAFVVWAAVEIFGSLIAPENPVGDPDVPATTIPPE